MGMEELAMVVDLAREVGVLLPRGLEHHLYRPLAHPLNRTTHYLLPWSHS